MTAETENETKVIDFLRAKGYSFRQKLGQGTYASVLGFETPDNHQVAVKIIQQDYSWDIEDKIWPLLQHQNILRVIEIFHLEKSKLYVMPKMPGILDETVFGLAFKYDGNALLRIKKWTYEVLSALKYLHSNGFCHLDLKSDNVLISESDSAILSDFSGLNLTGCPIKRICSPFSFRPPECYSTDISKTVEGESFDMWTFGLMTLNVLTGLWFQCHLPDTDEQWSWHTHVLPMLQENVKEANFEYLMRKCMPSVGLNPEDVRQALDFIQSALTWEPSMRPSAAELMKHPFVRGNSSPFFSPRKLRPTNPFQVKEAMALPSVKDDPWDETARSSKNGNCFAVSKKSEVEVVVNRLPPKYVSAAASGIAQDWVSNEKWKEETKSPCKRKPVAKRIRNFFRKAAQKVFGGKKNYVRLSEEDEEWSHH